MATWVTPAPGGINVDDSGEGTSATQIGRMSAVRNETILLVGAPDEVAHALTRAGFSVRTATDARNAAKLLCGVDLIAPVVRIPPDLTPREQQVVGLGALGLTQQGIAEALTVAAGTIKTLRRRLGEKLKRVKPGKHTAPPRVRRRRA